MIETVDALHEAVLTEALAGLSATPKTLPPWLFYDDVGSELFEQITELPEYYLTRAERSIFAERADEIAVMSVTGYAESHHKEIVPNPWRKKREAQEQQRSIPRRR